VPAIGKRFFYGRQLIDIIVVRKSLKYFIRCLHFYSDIRTGRTEKIKQRSQIDYTMVGIPVATGKL